MNRAGIGGLKIISMASQRKTVKFSLKNFEIVLKNWLPNTWLSIPQVSKANNRDIYSLSCDFYFIIMLAIIVVIIVRINYYLLLFIEMGWLELMGAHFMHL